MTAPTLTPAHADAAPQLFEVQVFRADRPDAPADVVPFFAASLDEMDHAVAEILRDTRADWGNVVTADGADITVIEVA